MYMKNLQNDVKDVAIIGGGAAGLMCAAFLANENFSTVLFEKNRSEKKFDADIPFDNAYLGKKLLITGKGRCNFTNDCTLEEFLKNVPTNPKFLFAAFSSFPPQSVMDFFSERNVPVKVERGNRAFPASDRALDILKALKSEIRNKIQVKNVKIEDICKNEDLFYLTDEYGEKHTFKKVVVCTGGLSYPQTGSTGDGYDFAKKFGHTVVDAVPSLVPLETEQAWCTHLAGLSLKNVRLSLMDKQKNKCVFSEIGEMLFTHFGISGPLVLSASCHIPNFEKGRYFIEIDLKCALSDPELDARLLSDFSKYANKNMANATLSLLPSRLVPIFLDICGIPYEIKSNSVTREQRKKMIYNLKHLTLEISGKRPVDEAIITSGGVCTKEINASTMESKLCTGLYFAGEVLDVDAYTGGFNLQIAFSTAHLAAKSIKKSLLLE